MSASKLEQLLAWQLRVTGVPEWVNEYRFDAVRRWRLDFAWPAHKLGVEVEGGVYTQGRHVRPAGFTKDCEKYNSAAGQGWTVLRFTAQQVRSGQAAAMVERWLLAAGRK
jgi:very-short-patch-repair endonuclease